jgi:hypothetical protein
VVCSAIKRNKVGKKTRLHGRCLFIYLAGDQTQGFNHAWQVLYHCASPQAQKLQFRQRLGKASLQKDPLSKNQNKGASDVCIWGKSLPGSGIVLASSRRSKKTRRAGVSKGESVKMKLERKLGQILKGFAFLLRGERSQRWVCSRGAALSRDGCLSCGWHGGIYRASQMLFQGTGGKG